MRVGVLGRSMDTCLSGCLSTTVCTFHDRVPCEEILGGTEWDLYRIVLTGFDWI